MNNLFVIWNASAPRTHRRVLFRFNENRKWRYLANWKFNIPLPHWNIITPFFRFQKCNGAVYIGLGNHYLEIGF